MHQKNQKVIILIICLFSLSFAGKDYVKIIHNTDPQAKCLDGTPGLLYVHQGGDLTKFLIFFQGGGLCGDTTLAKTTQNCYQRSKTLLGSSTLWPDTIQGQGYLSTDPGNNMFAYWTKIIFGYCDGSLHQGYTKAPLKYKDANLYFRGAAITRSHFKWLQAKYKISQAQKIMMTGGSAGALGSLYWTNYLRDMVNNPSIVSTIADSGIFINAKTHQSGSLKIQSQMVNLYKLSNVDEKTPLTICNAAKFQQSWRCLFIQYSFASIQGRILLINSEYDAWAIPNILQVNCLKGGKSGLTLNACTNNQKKQIQKYRDQFKTFISNYLQFSKNSAWTISCANHVYACLDQFYDSPDQMVPGKTGDTVRKAIEKYMFQGKRITDIDAEAWPDNQACAY